MSVSVVTVTFPDHRYRYAVYDAARQVLGGRLYEQPPDPPILSHTPRARLGTPGDEAAYEFVSIALPDGRQWVGLASLRHAALHLPLGDASEQRLAAAFEGVDDGGLIHLRCHPDAGEAGEAEALCYYRFYDPQYAPRYRFDRQSLPGQRDTRQAPEGLLDLGRQGRICKACLLQREVLLASCELQ